MHRLPLSLGSLFGILVSGCVADPVLEARITELGMEAADTKAGPNHRPGQPCELCHREAGEAQPFSLAGTIYGRPADKYGRPGVKLVFEDSLGKRWSTKSNCAGNFFASFQQFDPSFPLWVWLEDGEVHKPLESRIFRERSCGGCHRYSGSQRTTPVVFLSDDELEVLPEMKEKCP